MSYFTIKEQVIVSAPISHLKMVPHASYESVFGGDITRRGEYRIETFNATGAIAANKMEQVIFRTDIPVYRTF
jgi:hypothetical protein